MKNTRNMPEKSMEGWKAVRLLGKRIAADENDLSDTANLFGALIQFSWNTSLKFFVQVLIASNKKREYRASFLIFIQIF